MAEAPVQPAVPFMFFSPGRSRPVKHLYLNFGETGERRDGEGNLWIQGGRSPFGFMKDVNLVFASSALYYEGVDWTNRDLRRSAVYTPIENTDTPFVFASAARGIKRLVLPITTRGDGKGVYTVRLGFCAQPGDKTGQRVFDVRLNGKTALRDFDIMKEAGKPDRAIWKEFVLSLDGNLVLDLLAKTQKPTLDQMPLLNGLVVFRKEMTTFGFRAPESTWLNVAAREKIIELKLTNLRGAAFRGEIVFEVPKGITVSAPDGGALVLEPGARLTVPITLKADGEPEIGDHIITVKLVADDDSVALERKMPVAWLGILERRVLRGGAANPMGADLPKLLGKRVHPNHHYQLRVRGTSPGKEPLGAAAILWFPVPKEAQGRIRKACLRLHVNSVMTKLQDAMPGAGPAKDDNLLGEMRRPKGKLWPDLGKLKYPERLETLPESSHLAPVPWDPGVVEAPVPGDLAHAAEPNQITLAVEPTGLGGVVYWSAHPEAGGRAPVLLIDYEPEKKDK